MLGPAQAKNWALPIPLPTSTGQKFQSWAIVKARVKTCTKSRNVKIALTLALARNMAKEPGWTFITRLIGWVICYAPTQN